MVEESNICWTPAGGHPVRIPPVVSLEEQVRVPATSTVPAPSRPGELTLHRVAAGNLYLASHEGVLYVSPAKPGAVITDADREAARTLGYYGPLPIHTPE